MRFLLAWELGGGFGHLAPLRAIAREMRSRGHECVFAVRHLEPAVAYLNDVPGRNLQAPVSIRANDPPPFEHLSYASILFGCGFHPVSALTARTLAWRSLIELCGCEAIIAHQKPWTGRLLPSMPWFRITPANRLNGLERHPSRASAN